MLNTQNLATIAKIEKLLESLEVTSKDDQYLLVSTKLLVAKLAISLIRNDAKIKVKP